MIWHTIRLDLARTADHPDGWHGFSYLLRLPLDRDGFASRTETLAHQEQATVLRSHPDVPDVHGHVAPRADGWVLSYRPGEADNETIVNLDRHPIRESEYLTIVQPDGRPLPFQVMTCAPIATLVA